MPRIVDYYFSVSSPWTYLGFAHFLEIAKRHGLEVNYKPVFLGEVFEKTGGLPLAKRHPARQRYRLVELQRWRELRGLTLNVLPRFWPFDQDLVDRTIIALVLAGHDPERFTALAHEGVWVKELDLADEAVVAGLLREAELDPKSLIETAKGNATEVIYILNQENAIDSGVFGAPSYVVDGEVFWGQDRLDLLDHMLTSGRAPYRPE